MSGRGALPLRKNAVTPPKESAATPVPGALPSSRTMRSSRNIEWSGGLLSSIGDTDGDMVLEVSSHTFECNGGCDAMALEFLGIADARQHQKLRRIDNAACQDDSRSARTRTRPPLLRYSMPAARLPSSTTRAANALVSIVRFPRRIAGRR